MTRLEGNAKIVKELAKKAEELKPTCTYDDMIVFHFGTIATMLIDISESLAILADKTDK